ncbi:hypothetical protein F441_09099 [Phytophthora nicotianae CJ01A1]|uniref:Uncharacterized protein n=1 Tax=Phytophthora nicotianae CJ01A1 TaxID=1317063 RepID=W2X303_PHYNI|nr:hypothetical protein F441_09099 [Phytophthora nicotianae CJ01A1]
MLSMIQQTVATVCWEPNNLRDTNRSGTLFHTFKMQSHPAQASHNRFAQSVVKNAIPHALRCQ